MKAIRVILGVAVWAVAVAAGLVLILGAWRAPVDIGVGEWMIRYCEIALSLGILIVGLAVLWAMSLITRSGSAEYLSYKGQDGDVRIRLTAVRDYLSRLQVESGSVQAVRPTVRLLNGRLTVDLACKVSSGQPVGDLCRSLQANAKNALQSGLGLDEVGAIHVTVREFSGSPPVGTPGERQTAAESDAEASAEKDPWAEGPPSA